MRGWETRHVGPQPGSAQQRRAAWGEDRRRLGDPFSPLSPAPFMFLSSCYISSRKHHTTKGRLSLKGMARSGGLKAGCTSLSAEFCCWSHQGWPLNGGPVPALTAQPESHQQGQPEALCVHRPPPGAGGAGLLASKGLG